MGFTRLETSLGFVKEPAERRELARQFNGITEGEFEMVYVGPFRPSERSRGSAAVEALYWGSLRIGEPQRFSRFGTLQEITLALTLDSELLCFEEEIRGVYRLSHRVRLAGRSRDSEEIIKLANELAAKRLACGYQASIGSQTEDLTSDVLKARLQAIAREWTDDLAVLPIATL